ncbi:hypothetical protein B0H34DRAFT_682307 [Crassisporium funariophilum]|nr:hypothetical protein B0H34DRAFT_682307 [Crassisporium funariophilum]
MGKTKNLKSALQSQQSRLKAKQKISHAAQVTEQKTRKKGQQTLPHKGPSTSRVPSSAVDTKGKGSSIANPLRRPTIPFKPTDKILLIGEGNFSFARALIVNPPSELQSLPPRNITATAYDSEEECYAKYPDAHSIVAALRSSGVEIIFGVDGTRLERVSKLKGRRWDRIVWNFPHAGKGISDQDRNILSNQVLLLGFLRSAAKLLRDGLVPAFMTTKKKKKKTDDDDDEDEDEIDHEAVALEEYIQEGLQSLAPDYSARSRGTVLITLRNVVPYTQWDLPRLAKNPPISATGSSLPNPRYTLLRSFQFQRDAWTGYEHRMTKGERGLGKGITGEGGEDRTWEFCLPDDPSI